MREPAVMLTHSPRGWAQQLHLHLMDHGGARVAGYVVSASDTLSEAYDVLIADDVASFLTPRLVGDVRRRGAGIVGVFDPAEADGAGKQRLVELGVDDVVPLDADIEEIVETIARVAGPFVIDDPDIERLRSEVQAQVSPLAATLPELVVVTGASGGVGATEVSIGLAGRMRRRHDGVAVLDADERGPALGQRLRLPPEPNLALVVDEVIHRHGDVARSLHRHGGLGVEVLPGTPDPRRVRLRPDDVATVVGDLRSSGRAVVVDVAPRSEAEGTQSTIASRLTAMATSVVLVGRATPVGCRHIVEWLADAGSLEADVHVVVNHHDGGAYTLGEISAELRRRFAVASLHVVAHDRRVARAAWDGVPVRSRAFRRAMRRLDDAIAAAGVA